MEPLLRVEHITICYNGKPVVHDVSFELQQGEILGIVGESGSGKSTIIKAVMGLLGNSGLVTRGDIYYKGQNVIDMPQGELRKLLGPEIGMVFQDCKAALCPIRTVGDQIFESMSEPPLDLLSLFFRIKIPNSNINGNFVFMNIKYINYKSKISFRRIRI